MINFVISGHLRYNEKCLNTTKSKPLITRLKGFVIYTQYLKVGGGAPDGGGVGGCETKRRQLTRVVHFEWNKGNQTK